MGSPGTHCGPKRARAASGQLTCTGVWQEACCKGQMAHTGGNSTFHTRLSFKSSWSACPLNVLRHLIFKAKFSGREVLKAQIWLLMKTTECMAILFEKKSQFLQRPSLPPASATVPPYFQSVAFVYKNSSNIDFLNSAPGVSQA